MIAAEIGGLPWPACFVGCDLCGILKRMTNILEGKINRDVPEMLVIAVGRFGRL